VWCGSLGIAEYLLGKPETVTGKTVIELGAGTGILGMLTKRMGAKKVLLTDHDQRSLDHMEVDCARNAVEAEVVKLDWFNPILPLSTEGDRDGEDGGVVVIAGDVIYKSALVQPFMVTVSLLLHTYQERGARAEFYLCHIPRGGPRVEYAHVEEAATAHDLLWEIIPEEAWKRGSCLDRDVVPADDVNRARVFKMTPKPNPTP
jgi:hypothetical protein